MRTYRFQAMDQNGKRVNGKLQAEDATQLYLLLQNKQLFPTSYQEEKGQIGFHKRIDHRALAIMCRQLSAMLIAGVPLVNAIDMLQLTASQRKTNQMYEDLVERVRKGYSLSHSLKQSVVSFPALLIHLVESGEESGTLDAVLARLAVHYEKEHKMVNKITSAMMYPVILLVVTLVVVVGLMTFVLPTFFTMFEGVELPWNTRFLIWLSEFLLHYGWLLAILGVAMVPLFQMLRKQREFAIVWDRMKLRVWLFGGLYRTILTSRFARTFSSLFGNGVGVIQSLEITNDVLHNAYVKVGMDQAIDEVKQGESLSKSLHGMNLFDELLHSMLLVGEESGNLDGILNTVADYYDEEADNAITKMIALLEPMMIVILALIIGFVLLSVIVPIYSSFSLVG